MVNKKIVLKVKYQIETARPWEVLRPESEEEYHKHGRKYSINQLYSLHTNARKDYFFVFDSAQDKRRYIEDLRNYKANMSKRRAIWEKEQEDKRKAHETAVKAGEWRLKADTLVHDMRQSHEDE